MRGSNIKLKVGRLLLYMTKKQNPKRLGNQMHTLVQVWTDLNASKSYSGLSLHEVRSGFQPSFDARARVAAAQAELTASMQERDLADLNSTKLYERAIAAIVADPREGKQGQAYRAVMAAARTARRSGTKGNEKLPGTPPVSALTVVKPAA